MYDEWGYDDNYHEVEQQRTTYHTVFQQGSRAVDITEKDFVQHIIGWKLGELKEPLTQLTSAPNIVASQNMNSYALDAKSYYRQYLPGILDEARASISDGLEAKKKNQRQQFTLKLSEKPKPAKQKGNPTTLNFSGWLPEEDRNSISMNILLLTTNPSWKDRSGVTMLAIANCNQGEIKAKTLLFEGTIRHNQESFQGGKKWFGWYLTSVVSQQRMFEACVQGAQPACLNPIIMAKTAANSELNYSDESSMPSELSKLNESQKSAAIKFIRSSANSISLLQGPPGTGKTTTIVSMLRVISKGSAKTTLVCAPSNKALQVLALRFLNDNPGIPIILMGVEQKIPEDLKEISLHNWKATTLSLLENVNKPLTNLANFTFSKKNTIENNKELLNTQCDRACNAQRALAMQLNKYSMISTANSYPYSQKTDLDSLLDKINELKSMINQFDMSQVVTRRSSPVTNDEEPMKKVQDFSMGLLLAIKAFMPFLTVLSDKIKSSIVQKSDEALEKHLLKHSRIIFCTLVTSGRVQLRENMPPIGALIIDEAAQSVEAESLIAFQHHPERVLLVGDTKQLPATVISKPAADKHFDWSMMWRLIEENRFSAEMLTIQYRMKPGICLWPSKQYYEGKLQTDPSVLKRSPLLGDNPLLLKQRAFFDVKSNEVKVGHSCSNDIEVRAIADIVKKIRSTNQDCKIGIISFYAAQVNKLEASFKKQKLKTNLRISSVDGFQGDECDIIIISCVRTSSKTIGFLNDFRRLNVAITRAKDNLIVVGNGATLKKHPSDIQKMLTDMRSCGDYYTEDKLNELLGKNKNISASQSKKISKQASKPKLTLEKKSANGPSAKKSGHGQEAKPAHKTAPKLIRGAAAQKLFANKGERGGANTSVSIKSQATSAKRSKGKKEAVSSSVKKKGRCRFFNGKVNSCTKGSDCEFKHITPSN